LCVERERGKTGGWRLAEEVGPTLLILNEFFKKWVGTELGRCKSRKGKIGEAPERMETEWVSRGTEQTGRQSTTSSPRRGG